MIKGHENKAKPSLSQLLSPASLIPPMLTLGYTDTLLTQGTATGSSYLHGLFSFSTPYHMLCFIPSYFFRQHAPVAFHVRPFRPPRPLPVPVLGAALQAAARGGWHHSSHGG